MSPAARVAALETPLETDTVAHPGLRYPAEWIDQWRLPDGRRLTLRPVLPQDAPGLQALVARQSPLARRRRFHGALNALPAAWLQRMTTVDHHEQVALVVTCREGADERLVADARYARCGAAAAEFAIVVDEACQRQGIGRRSLGALLAVAGSQGLRWLHGDVLEHNVPMLALTRRLGFVPSARAPEPGCVRVERRVRAVRLALPSPVNWWQRLLPARGARL